MVILRARASARPSSGSSNSSLESALDPISFQRAKIGPNKAELSKVVIIVCCGSVFRIRQVHAPLGGPPSVDLDTPSKAASPRLHLRSPGLEHNRTKSGIC